MRDKTRFTLGGLMWAVALLAAYAVAAHAQTSANSGQQPPNRRAAVQPAAIGTPVTGNGTTGQITKWTGNNALGDSVMTEDKNGRIGIGTITPTSKVTVQGVIESTLGGYKFPDGTLQTTAASPGGFVVPLVLSGSAAGPILSVINSAGAGAEIEGGFGGGTGLVATGGLNLGNTGGTGITVSGGGALGSGNDGGIGLLATGGTSELDRGGVAIFAFSGKRKDTNPAFDGLAGYFSGDVQITGNLAKGGGSFKIDHPLDPANKYLYHSFVESPDMMNIYNGNATTDANGQAIITMPDYFEALNRDFRYQLTVIGTFAQAIVGEEISGNRFTIKTNAPGVKVSWQVTGVRHDPYANKHRIPVEEVKNEKERGYYVHPDVFNQPEEKAIEWVRHPEPMQRIKTTREQ